MKWTILLSLVMTLSMGLLMAADAAERSPYAGQEARGIKSLSAKDIEELSNGRGWGLAKVAELNGMPGPAHLLEMRDEIGLSHRQVERIESLYRAMKEKATVLGLRLIELERHLDESFVRRTVTQDSLARRLGEIELVRKELRLAHLETHLRTPELLTERQIVAYNRLRGYATNPPCNDGHGGHAHQGQGC